MKKTFQLKDIDPMIFSGAGDENIKIIEDYFNSKIVLRGNSLIVDGLKKEINEIELLVENIIYTITNKGFIDSKDIDILIKSSISQDIASNGESKLDNIILYTYKGAVVAQTKGQKKYYKSVCNNDIVFAIGPAGTGKTFQAVACAVSALKNNEVEKIVITRPVVEAGERLGFLPGDMKEKVDPYLRPLYDSLYDLFDFEKIQRMIEIGDIEIAPLAFMRGRTLKNSFAILDEAQNATDIQIKMFLTRIGENSKIVVNGDPTQIDLPNKNISGLTRAKKLLRHLNEISVVDFDHSDVVRHPLVTKIVKAYSHKNTD